MGKIRASRKNVKWETISSRGQSYKFEKPGQRLSGTYEGFKKVQTDDGERLIHQITPEGSDETVGVWESAILQVLRLVPKGTDVRITFQGLSKKKKRGQNAARLYDVDVPEGTKMLKSPKGVPF